ncbi:NAD-binding protein [Schizopora paradoxa]|uniref:NAD-binding protein n=1 Tax=Schizopora paradoxa TaxID=27342 RepID=A0A0H2S300_9AGAM|nr:NAD-binding protein [Schizopora paradoxa]
MPFVEPGSKVLVTGANGFIAVWILKHLLEAGYAVRGSIRSQEKATHLHSLFADYGTKFETIVVPDITEVDAFDEAIQGADAVIHAASPVSFSTEDPQDLIKPAVDGTISVLSSAAKFPNIKRVTQLSSAAAITGAADVGNIDERNWNDGALNEVKTKGRAANQVAKYQVSTYLAEKAAWDFVESHKSQLTSDFLTICPVLSFGPVLQETAGPDKLNETMKEFADVVFRGEVRPADYQASWIDVRDVSRAHVLALQKKEAGGKRFLLGAGQFVWQDFYDIVNDLEIPGARAPVGEPGVGRSTTYVKTYNTSLARRVLGIEFGDQTTMTRDIIENLQQRGYLFASNF